VVPHHAVALVRVHHVQRAVRRQHHPGRGAAVHQLQVRLQPLGMRKKQEKEGKNLEKIYKSSRRRKGSM
jgi:hypothetical protein